MAGDSLLPTVLDWIQGRADASFDELALAAFRFQYQRIEPYRRWCRQRGVEPESVSDWRQVPPVPTLAFKTLELAAEPARETFRSSGTTSTRRSVHHHPYPDLYRAVIDATYPPAMLAGLGPGAGPPTLSLIPGRDQAPDSSLSFLAEHVLEQFGGDGSARAVGPGGVVIKTARSWLAARQRDGRPGVLLATAFALDQLVASLARLELRFRLPAGTRIFETGGFKGRARRLAADELRTRMTEHLGVPPSMVVREYGMTELTSHFYTRALQGDDPDRFVAPPWVRVQILDPESLAPAERGHTGLIAVFDLANVGSAVHLLTEDLGTAEGDGFRLAGRAAGAELRGCSLTAEELAG